MGIIGTYEPLRYFDKRSKAPPESWSVDVGGSPLPREALARIIKAFVRLGTDPDVLAKAIGVGTSALAMICINPMTLSKDAGKKIAQIIESPKGHKSFPLATPERRKEFQDLIASLKENNEIIESTKKPKKKAVTAATVTAHETKADTDKTLPSNYTTEEENMAISEKDFNAIKKENEELKVQVHNFEEQTKSLYTEIEEARNDKAIAIRNATDISKALVREQDRVAKLKTLVSRLVEDLV